MLGLIFLKYVSDSFTEKYDELKAEGYGDEEDRDEYLADNIFWVPKEARWETIKAHATNPDIGTESFAREALIDYFEEILSSATQNNVDWLSTGSILDMVLNGLQSKTFYYADYSATFHPLGTLTVKNIIGAGIVSIKLKSNNHQIVYTYSLNEEGIQQAISDYQQVAQDTTYQVIKRTIKKLLPKSATKAADLFDAICTVYEECQKDNVDIVNALLKTGISEAEKVLVRKLPLMKTINDKFITNERYFKNYVVAYKTGTTPSLITMTDNFKSILLELFPQ